MSTITLQPQNQRLIDPETGLRLRVGIDQTLRVKIIDSCGMACTFCHNEGTPVAIDNSNSRSGQFVDSGRSGRVSIYLATNGAKFLPGPVEADDEFANALRWLREATEIQELHLTGGEPTLHPRIADIVRVGRDAGLRVGITSNGENGARVLPACADAGLDRVNFSIFGTTGPELAQVQHAKFADRARADRKIRALRRSIDTTLAHGVRASANIVVPDHSHIPRIERLLTEHAADLSVRLLNSLDQGQESIDAINDALDDLGAVAVERHLIAGTSGCRTAYRLPNGRIVYFKQIRRVRLPRTCAGCRFNSDADCHEGYYGIRLYKNAAGGYLVGVCIQRMDLCMPVEEFVTSDLCHEINDLRRAEYDRLIRAATA